jgi:regulator of replication initiation timing
MKELFDNLQQFQKEIGSMNLPTDEAENVKSNVNLAIKEAQKPQPDPKKIQSKFQGAIDTVKEVGDTIQTVSKWDWTQKILSILGKIGLKILL